MQLKFFHDVKCIIFIIEVLLLSPFINNFFGIILTYLTNHDILYHKSHWTCRLIANLLQKWLVITVRPTTSVRKNPRKKLPPCNTPDHFAAVSPRQNSSPAAERHFSFSGQYLENFMSRPDVIPTFRQRRCTNRGRNFVRSKRWPHYMSSTTSTYFCVLTIRKHLLKLRFERSGRGQEPSRGHKFSIFENVVLHRDFTSSMRLHFRSDLVGACLPQTLLMVRTWRCEQQRRVVLT